MGDGIVLRKFKDTATGRIFSLDTTFVEREISVPTKVSVPLYVGGELLSDAELEKLGLEIVGYTQDEVDAEYYAGLYASNPDLAGRVRTYRDFLDGLGLGYQATTDEIEAAIEAREDLDAAGRLALASKIRTAFQNVVVNLELMGNPTASGDAWIDMPKLVKYLPAEAEAE